MTKKQKRTFIIAGGIALVVYLLWKRRKGAATQGESSERRKQLEHAAKEQAIAETIQHAASDVVREITAIPQIPSSLPPEVVQAGGMNGTGHPAASMNGAGHSMNGAGHSMNGAGHLASSMNGAGHSAAGMNGAGRRYSEMNGYAAGGRSRRTAGNKFC